MKKGLTIIFLICAAISIDIFLSFEFTQAQDQVIHLDDSITKPYFLNQSNTLYVLDSDITTLGTAFVVDGENITLDLNGHTVIFGNTNVTGIPNYDFEQGIGDVPDNWDLSQAPSAKRMPTAGEMPLVGDWLLKFDQPTTTQEIVSDWVNIPEANRTYMAVIFIVSSWGCMHRLKVEFQDGSIVAESSSDNLEGAGMLNVRFKPTEVGTEAGNYRLRIISEEPNGKSSWIDYADLRPAYDSGIVMRNYFDRYRTPDLTSFPNPGAHQNFVLKNGRIVEGIGKGIKYRAIHKGSGGLMEIDNVYTEVSGVDSSNFWGEYSSNTIFRNSTSVNRAAGVTNRHALDNFPVFSGSNMKFYNNIIEGGQGGVSTAGFNNVEIYNNTFRINASFTNHYAVTTYESDNIRVYNNRFEPYHGPGILFSSRTTNSQIYNNYFNFKNMGPIAEYTDGFYTTSAIRVTDYNSTEVNSQTQNNKIFDNVVIGTAQSLSQYPNFKATAIGLNLSTGGYNEYYHNDIRVTRLDNKAEAIAVKGSAIQIGLLKENRLSSNHINVWLGTNYGPSANGNFVSNTFIRGIEPIDYHTLKIGYWTSAAENHTFLDTKFENGASLSDIKLGAASGGGNYSFYVKWYLDILVKDSFGNPIPDAAITATATGGAAETVSKITDASGKARLELTEYYRYGITYPPTSNYNNYTPHNVTISKSGYPTESKTLTMDSSKEMTVILAGTEPPALEQDFASDFTQVKAYPNPFRGDKHNQIIFDNLTANVRIRIYTLGGELVKEISEQVGDKAYWDVKNQNEGKVASGIYIYYITNPKGQEKKGKVVIIK